jgi:hypothetical protein
MRPSSIALAHPPFPIPPTAAVVCVGATSGIGVGQAGGPLVQVAAAGAGGAALVAMLVVEAGAEFLHRAGGERAGFTVERKGANSTKDWRD